MGEKDHSNRSRCRIALRRLTLDEGGVRPLLPVSFFLYL
jgi:hypothetical protein